MPLYEYECQQCRKHTEKRQKFSDVEITVCPHCGGVLQRVITAPSIAFKGGGWFKDGYGSVKPAVSAEASGGGDGKADAAGKGAADGKGGSGGSDASSGKSDAAASAPASAPVAAPTAAPAASSAKD